MIRGSKELIRSINCTNVLEDIINSEPISRAYLSKKLGLTKATISSIVQELINQKLVIEIGSDETKFGRKPILLSFNKKAGYAISIDLGKEIISASLMDLKGDDPKLKKIQTPKDSSQILNSLISLIQSMEQLTKESIFGIVGITIGIHGTINNNEVTYSNQYDFIAFDLKKELEQFFHIPVYLESDASLSAIGEYTYKSTYASLANINIHESISLGIVMDHVLYQGNHGFTGTIGHSIVKADGKPCYCGNHGCLEQYLSTPALLKEYQKLSGNSNASFESLYTEYKNGQPAAKEIINQFTKYTACCINNVLNMYRPDILVLNCPITQKLPELLNDIKQHLTCNVNKTTQIFTSRMEDSVLYGGICIAVKGFLHINHFVHGSQNQLF